MNWQEIRQRYPSTWLLVEALKAHTANNKRILEQLAVLNSFTDGQTAMQAYAQLHGEQPHRELFVFHTDRPELDVPVRRWLGLQNQRISNPYQVA